MNYLKNKNKNLLLKIMSSNWRNPEKIEIIVYYYVIKISN